MHIRPLAAADRPAIEDLCGATPEWDIFLLANLDQLAGDGSFVQYWGQFDDAGRMAAALMRYHVLWYVHVGPGADLRALAGVIETQGQPNIVLNEGGVEALQLGPLLAKHRLDLELSGRLRRLRAGDAVAAGADNSRRPRPEPTARYDLLARRATQEDVDRLAAFYADAPEDVRRGRASLRRSVEGGRRTFLAEKGNAITACALTTAELPSVAMVGGLFAVPEGEREEHLGLALRGLVGSLGAEGKDACVVSRDAWIDAALDGLGFDVLGPWWMLHMSGPS